MTEPYKAEQVYSIGHVNEYARERDAHHHHSHHPPAHYQAAAETPLHEHNVADVASVLGLPEGTLTPSVMAAVVKLLSEIERLRWQTECQHRREVFLEAQAERHPVVPAFNRRGFMRELEVYLSGGDPQGVLVVMHVGGIERLRLVHGLAAADGALRHVCGSLVGSYRASDVVGVMAGSDFAILLPGTGLADASAKLVDVIGRINAQPFSWGGQAVTLSMHPGFHVLEPGENAEAALDCADRARRKGRGEKGK